jgi:putative flippase GtrA
MKRTYEFIRYCLVGGLAFVADFATFLLFTDFFGVNYLVSNTLGFVVGLLVNYLASIYWVFIHRRYTKATPEFALFAIIGVGGVALGNLCMWYLVEHARLWHVYAKYLVTALVLFYNYALRKYFLFRAPVVVKE